MVQGTALPRYLLNIIQISLGYWLKNLPLLQQTTVSNQRTIDELADCVKINSDLSPFHSAHSKQGRQGLAAHHPLVYRHLDEEPAPARGPQLGLLANLPLNK